MSTFNWSEDTYMTLIQGIGNILFLILLSVYNRFVRKFEEPSSIAKI